jgi:hypothetical protein
MVWESISLDLQETLERVDDTKNRSRVLDERIRYAHEASRLLILDAYVSGQLAFICDVNAWGEVNAIGRSSEIADAKPRLTSPRFILHFNSLNMPLCENREKKPMFVTIVKAVHGPKGVIPSLARLYFVDHEGIESGAGSIYVSLFQHTLYLFYGLMNGKFGTVINVRGSEALDCLQPSVINGAREVVNSVSDQESQVVKCGIFQNIFDSVCSKLRVNLDAASCTLLKACDAPLDAPNVYIGPVHFGSRLSKDHAFDHSGLK